MSDNLFAEPKRRAFARTQEWFPLTADNSNAPLGFDVPSFAAIRGVRAATTVYTIQASRPIPSEGAPTPGTAGALVQLPIK